MRQGKESRHLWVGNLHSSVTEDDLMREFSRFGAIERVKLLKTQCAFIGTVAMVMMMVVVEWLVAHMFVVCACVRVRRFPGRRIGSSGVAGDEWTRAVWQQAETRLREAGLSRARTRLIDIIDRCGRGWAQPVRPVLIGSGGAEFVRYRSSHDSRTQPNRARERSRSALLQHHHHHIELTLFHEWWRHSVW